MGLDRACLEDMYVSKHMSAKQIANDKKVSEHKVNYWLKKHEIEKRTVSEAIYHWHHPKGDPFLFTTPQTNEDYKLWGLGIGLYWGEGNKANKTTVKLGNSDPELLKVFMKFLERFFKVNKGMLKFHLHTFTDIDLKKAMKFWENTLGVSGQQFYKPTVTLSGKLGNYRNKSEYGVLTLYYANVKLRNIIVGNLPR